jgi:hypothetical protein
VRGSAPTTPESGPRIVGPGRAGAPQQIQDVMLTCWICCSSLAPTLQQLLRAKSTAPAFRHPGSRPESAPGIAGGPTRRPSRSSLRGRPPATPWGSDRALQAPHAGARSCARIAAAQHARSRKAVAPHARLRGAAAAAALRNQSADSPARADESGSASPHQRRRPGPGRTRWRGGPTVVVPVCVWGGGRRWVGGTGGGECVWAGAAQTRIANCARFAGVGLCTDGHKNLRDPSHWGGSTTIIGCINHKNPGRVPAGARVRAGRRRLWEARARARHRLASRRSESLGVVPPRDSDGSGPMEKCVCFSVGPPPSA